MDDDGLVERIRQGDRAAAEELIRRHYAAVLRYCRARCENGDTAEDLTQETFLRLFKGLAGYRKRGRFRPFLYTIAHRLSIDESRRRRPCPLEDGTDVADGRDVIRQAEDRAEADRLLAALSPEQRQAVILRYAEQFSYRRIAQVTGCNLRTAQSRVRSALQIMRKVWNDDR